MPTSISKLALVCLAFVLATFVVQPLSHFVVNVEHFAAVDFMRKEPIFVMGLMAMLVQGLVLGYIYAKLYGSTSSIGSAIKFSLLMGLFLGSYLAFAEPAKYAVPNIGSWILVEWSASLIQFTIFGVLLSLIYWQKQA